jgi:hypothetical protein
MPQRSGFFLGGACLFALGLLLCLVTGPDVRERAARVPRMTFDELQRNGPGAHPYVTVTDARVCAGGFAFDNDADTGALDQLIVPVYDGSLREEPKPRDLQFLLRICDGREKDRVFARPDGVELTCEVRNDLGRIERWLLEDLAKQYPGIRLERCRLLTVGLHEPTEERARSVTLTGLTCLAAGALLGTLAFYRPFRAP